MEQNITSLRIALEVGLESIDHELVKSNVELGSIDNHVREMSTQLERIADALEKIANAHGRDF